MDMTIDQQVALDEALVPHASRLRIGRRNFRLKSDISSKESTLQLVYDVVTDSFLQGVFGHRKCSRNLHVGILGNCHGSSSLYKVEHKDTKKSNEMYYPRFTKVIIHYFLSNDPLIPRRNKVNWHYVRDDQMFTTIKLVSRHQNTQQFGAMFPIELTNADIRNSEAYKEYYAVATGAIPPKTKASVRKTKSSSDTTVTPPLTTAAGTRLFTSAKGKQPATTSKAKSLTALSEVAMTEAKQLKLATKRSLQQTLPSKCNEQDDDDAQDDDDDQEEGNDDDQNSDEEGEEFIHPRISAHDEKEIRDEESFDPIPKTPKNMDDEEEPMQTTHEMEEPSHPEFETGADDQPIAEPSQHPEWFSQQKKPPTPDHDWNKTLSATHGSIQPWISELAKQIDSRSSFNQLMDTPVDFSAFLMNRLKVETLTPKLLAGTTYELMKGSCKSLQHPHNLLKPLPLIPNSRVRRVIPFDHFINNDLEYLRGGALSRKYTTFVTKTKAADYEHIKWIEYLVPRTMWIHEPVGYDKHALWRISHWGCKRQQFYGFAVNRESARDLYSKRKIIAVIELKIVEWHNYKHLDCITNVYKKHRNPKACGRPSTRCRKLPEEAQPHKARYVDPYGFADGGEGKLKYMFQDFCYSDTFYPSSLLGYDATGESGDGLKQTAWGTLQNGVAAELGYQKLLKQMIFPQGINSCIDVFVHDPWELGLSNGIKGIGHVGLGTDVHGWSGRGFGTIQVSCRCTGVAVGKMYSDCCFGREFWLGVC
nr:hypothetical protein [Tanacetum cinerariifolium]